MWPKTTGKLYVTEPYYDDGGSNIAMVSVTRPVTDETGWLIGVAGTDLSLLFNETNTEFPHVDCAALHLRRILKGLLDDGSLDSGQAE